MVLLCSVLRNGLVKKAIVCMCVCVVGLGLVGVSGAAEVTKLTEMQYVVAEDVEVGTSRMTVYGYLLPDSIFPATAHFYAPSDFEFVDIIGLAFENDEPRETDVSATQTIEDNGFTRYDVVFAEESIFVATFTLDALMYDTTAMGGPSSASITELEVLPPNNLDYLTIGFVAPEGHVGVGDNIVRLGNDGDGNEVYGVDLTDVSGGEVIITTIAFGTPPEPNDTASHDAATLSQWYEEPFTWVVAALVLAVAGLCIILYMQLTRKGFSFKADDEETSDDKIAVDEE